MKRDDRRIILAGSYYAYVVTGMVVLILGSIMPYLREEFGLSYDKSGLLLALLAIGNLIASFIGGIISDYIGRKATLLIGSLCLVFGFTGFVVASSAKHLYIYSTIAGLGWGVMNSIVNAIVSDTTSGDTRTMNILHMFFAVGAFLSPFVMGIIIRLGFGWRYGIYLIIGLSAIQFFIFLAMPIPKISKEHRDDRDGETNGLAFLSNSRYYLFIGILFFYVGVESIINGWLVTYFVDMDILDEVSAQNVLSIFWIGLIVGRIIASYLAHRLSKEGILLISGLGGMATILLFLILPGKLMITICMFLSGMFYSAMYPTTIANASSIIENSGTATGIMLSFGGLGGAVLPYLIGIISKKSSISAGMNTIIIYGALLAIFTIVNRTRYREIDMKI